MKVRELKRYLAELDDELEIVEEDYETGDILTDVHFLAGTLYNYKNTGEPAIFLEEGRDYHKDNWVIDYENGVEAVHMYWSNPYF